MNESDNVERTLREIGVNLVVKRAFHQFIKGTTTVKMPGSLYTTETPLLSMTTNPEDKRKIIGDGKLRLIFLIKSFEFSLPQSTFIKPVRASLFLAPPLD